MAAFPRYRLSLIGALLFGLASWISCSSEGTPSGPEVRAISLAARPVQVRDTDPSGAEQGTVDLSVRVLGSGFEDPARVRLLMNGDTLGIVTSEVAEFVSDKELVTTVTVAEDAALGLWDVEVELLGKRRKGIGIELFEVKTKCLQPTYCDEGGQEPNAQAAWIGAEPDDAMIAGSQGVLTKESGRVLTVEGDLYSVDVDFDAVRALPVVVKDQDDPQSPVDQCVLEIPDLSGYDPSVTVEGIANTMKTRFQQDGLVPSRLLLEIGKKQLGHKALEHLVELKQVISSDEDVSLLNSDGTLKSTLPASYTWGRVSSDYPRIDLIDGSIRDDSAPRVFRISEGTLRALARLGSGSDAPLVVLLCDIPAGDAAIVSLEPL